MRARSTGFVFGRWRALPILIALIAGCGPSPPKTASLHVAAYNGDTGEVKGWLKRGADPNGRDANGYTPLHCAAMSNAKGAPGAVRILIAHGADIKARAVHWDYSTLHTAIQGGNPKTIEILLKAGADVN